MVFADGTDEGSRQEVLFIGAKRLGRLIETERVKRIFLSSTSKSLDMQGIGVLRSTIGAYRSRLKRLPQPLQPRKSPALT